MYCTPAYLMQLFSAREIAELSDPGTGPQVDAALLQLTIDAGDRSAYDADQIAAADEALVNLNHAIDQAGRKMNGYLTPRYPLPLEQSLVDGSALPDVCADITRYLLMDQEPTEEVSNRHLQAIAWLRDVQKNKASLGEADTAVATPAGKPIVKPGCSSIDWSTY